MNKSTRDLAQAVLNLFADETDTLTLGRKVAAYLVAERRVRDLDKVIRQVTRLRQEQFGVVEAVVTSAYPLDPSAIQAVKQIVLSNAPNARTAVLDTLIDPSLLGGLRVSTEEYDVDVSLRGKLQQLKHLAVRKGIV